MLHKLVPLSVPIRAMFKYYRKRFPWLSHLQWAWADLVLFDSRPQMTNRSRSWTSASNQRLCVRIRADVMIFITLQYRIKDTSYCFLWFIIAMRPLIWHWRCFGAVSMFVSVLLTTVAWIKWRLCNVQQLHDVRKWTSVETRACRVSGAETN